MQAVTLPSFGGPEVLTLAEVPDAVAGPGEVLVDVAATAVNRADLLQRQGFYNPPAGASPYPGLECSGVISALGEGVAGWAVGDEVCALLSGGGYASKVAVPVGQLLPIPAGVSLIDAAALPEVACTVWSNVFQLAALQPGEHCWSTAAPPASGPSPPSSRPGTAPASPSPSGLPRKPPAPWSWGPPTRCSTRTRTSSPAVRTT
jgi:NADPH:quinone reductase-like Zn-dependent oxidoreductase